MPLPPDTTLSEYLETEFEPWFEDHVIHEALNEDEAGSCFESYYNLAVFDLKEDLSPKEILDVYVPILVLYANSDPNEFKEGPVNEHDVRELIELSDEYAKLEREWIRRQQASRDITRKKTSTSRKERPARSALQPATIVELKPPSEDTANAIAGSLTKRYKAITRSQIATMLQGTHFLVVKAKDKVDGRHYAPDAEVKLISDVSEVRREMEGYTFLNSAVLSRQDYLVADVLYMFHTELAGLSSRFGFPFQIFMNPDMIIKFKMLVDTGSPIIYLCLDSGTFNSFEEAQYQQEIKGGLGSIMKAKELMLEIDETPAGLIKTVHLGHVKGNRDSQTPWFNYLRHQFEGCDGILGIDISKDCHMSLSRGKYVIFPISYRHELSPERGQ